MRIGVNLITLNRALGGAYQYGEKFTRALLTADSSNEYTVFYDDDSILEEGLRKNNVTMVPVEPRQKNLRSNLRHKLQIAWLAGLPLDIKLIRERYFVLSHSQLDLLIQPQMNIGALFSDVPFITSVHDSVYQFSRKALKRTNKKFLLKHYLLVKALMSRAKGVIVDSENGKGALVRGCTLPPDKIFILPFLPPDYITPRLDVKQIEQVRRKYKLPDAYLFYPSVLHLHKNHLGLFSALCILRERFNIEPPLVLVGPKADAFKKVMLAIKQRGLSQQVRYLGYVEDEDMGPLYKMARALVMPTFMGPTNIPVIEAFSLGCPVICSNVAGYEQQIGDAGILIDPNSTDGLASAIYRVWMDEKLRIALAKRGYQRINGLQVDDYGKRIMQIVHHVVGKETVQ